MATDIELFIGTSQDFLLSFKVKKTDQDKYVLERFIAHRCHSGSIICMDTSGRYLATGGGDDKIVVIDLKLNRDVHEIIRHSGSINSLSFTNKGSDLLSGSDDGRLVATTVGSWKQANVWKKPHTGKPVLKVCLHHSDKFALTLGKDGTLRGWDMLKGSQINTFNTKDLSDANIVLDNVELCPDGNTFAMSGAKTVTLISFHRDEPYDELALKSRVTSMCWLDNENLLVGMENGSIEWSNINTSEHVNLPNIHSRRIKGMHHLNGFLGTICSAGSVSLWATTVSDKQLTLICTTNDSFRPTCIKLINASENRYQAPVNIPADNSTEILTIVNQPRLRSLSTTGKVIVEMSDKKKKDNRSKKEERKVHEHGADSDTDSETPKKKKKEKKKIGSPKDVVTITPTSKRKKTKATPTKPIVVRSPNSDDDLKTKSTKKDKVTTPKQSATKRSTSNSQKESSTSFHDGTPIVEKSMKRRKLDLNRTEPSHVMATRRRLTTTN